MYRTVIKRFGRIIVFVTAIVMLAAMLLALDSTHTTVDAASLKHIDEIVAQSGTFNILEIVPDTAAASIGYYVGGQEPAAGWRTAVAGLTSPSGRSAYVNGLFQRLASNGVLSGGTETPLRYTYYDTVNNSYYSEAYEVEDPQNWSLLHLNTIESVTVTGTMTPKENGPYRANYVYTPEAGGGYVQDIAYFSYTDAPVYGQETYYYNPVFTMLTSGMDLTGWDDVAIYMAVKDGDGNDILDGSGNRIYAVGEYITVKEIIDHGGFDTLEEYYYIDPTQTGAPGNFSYAAHVPYTDIDDAPSDGFIAPASGDSYFSRSVSSYVYVITGGNYEFSETGADEYIIDYTNVYYMAGFENNNLFKTLVFGLDSSTMSALNVTVSVRKAAEVTTSEIKAAGLIYISSGTDITQSGVTTVYTAQNDIPDARAVEIYNYAAKSNAVIIDGSIIQGVTQATPPESLSAIQKLCLLSLQSSISQTEETSLSALTVDWTTLAFMINDADKTFVNNNVYCFTAFNDQTLGSPANIGWLVTPRVNSSFSQSVYSDGFSAVLTEIENENFLRTIAGEQTLLPENVSVANAVRHIINYKGRRGTNSKTAIRVLDLEPAKVTSATWLTTETVLGWIDDSLPAEEITIVHMTTGEFSGKIEDLGETYDMIYIGMSTETMNKSGGNTVYNDTSMNGLVYTNIGDKYYATIEMAGIRNQDYLTVDGVLAINGAIGTNANLFRFSGNDITNTAVTELQKYVQAGYPIILADGFVSGSGINTAKVDNSSYMYQAVSNVYGIYANVMSESAAVADNETVIQYMNVSKPSVLLTGQPVEYANDPNVTLTRDLHDGYYYLSYAFSINNVTDPTPISTTYDCNLYIDLNADGRYAANEELDDIVVYRVTDGALILPLTDGGGSEYYALSADVEYQVTRQMPDDYVGIIPWKLSVIKNGANQIHASQQGFTRIAAGSNIQTIKVLQIMQNGTSGTKLNLSTQMSDPQGIYGILIRGLKDFQVTIDAIENDDLELMGDSGTILSYLDGYDMLIIGFNDCYNGIDNDSAQAIVDYIGSGKSVLFTHDTTSLTQVPTYNFPMAVNGEAPNIRTLSQTDVLYNTSASEYQSINGNIYWNAGFSWTSPPYIRQYNPTYIVFLSSNVTSSNEQDYYNAYVSGQIYRVTSTGYSAISNPTSYTSFKTTTGSAPVIYVYCTSASGWYGTGNFANRYNLTTTNNFTKFVGGSGYACTGLTYYYAYGSKPMTRYENLTTTTYDQIMKDIYYSNPNSYSVVGTYDAWTNTYSIGGQTYWPATDAPFPQSTLYDRDPAGQYELSTIPNGITDWGYYFNTVIRDAVGLDRYGVTSPLLGSIVNVTAPMPYDSIITILQNNRSVAFAPSSGRASTVNEYQGYTNYALIRFAVSGNTYRYTANNYYNRETTNISQVNKGQITTYPYNVNTLDFGGNDATITGYGGSYMKIGKTHEQYFQINMNTDDIVVWYCMSSGGTDDNSYYDDVPNDCVNAYYIYNKGNVTYSGVGHSSSASLYTGTSVGQEYINEAKLFVNTMIAAYQSGEQTPEIKIVKDARGTSALSQKFIVYDEQYDPSSQYADEAYSPVLIESFGPTDESRAVYFKISDPNLGVHKDFMIEYSYSYQIGDEITTGTLEGITTYRTDDSVVETTVDDTTGNVYFDVRGGFVYKVFLPNEVLNALANSSVYSVKVTVELKSVIDGELKTDSSELNLKKQQLFELS